MKKQVVIGWAYPCDREKLLGYDSSGSLYITGDDIFKTKRAFKDLNHDCECKDKHCKQPIKVRVTVEPLTGAE